MLGKGVVLPLVAACSVLLLALGCQPSQPTPKAGEKAAATATKPAATPTKPAEKPIKGGKLRVITGAGPVTLDPHVATGDSLVNLVYDTLIWQDQDQNITKEGLVKDWTITPDGKRMTLKLREGVKFHDGTDFDAAAVKFNIERVKDPATKALYRSDYANAVSVEVVDVLTVRLNLTAPSPLLLSAMAAKAGYLVSPAAVKKWGQDFGRNPVGSGPFRFVEWVPGDHVTYRGFEGYWRKDQDGVQLPYLEQVVGQIAVDQDVAFANLRTGQTDLVPSLPVQRLAALKSDPNLTYSARRQPIIHGLYLNTVRPPFDNKALRQAVALALDRQGIAARMGEAATAHASVLHPDMWAYDEKAGRFPERDLAKAKAKMAEAGYAGGLKVKMPSWNTEEGMLNAQIVKANLAEIGLEAEIEVLASATLQTRIRGEQSYGISPFGSLGGGLADPGYLWGQTFHSQGGRNYFGPYSNPQVDQLLDKAGSIYDQKERTALYREAAKVIADDAPFIPWYVSNGTIGMSKKVRNYVQYPDTHMHLVGVWLAQ